MVYRKINEITHQIGVNNNETKKSGCGSVIAAGTILLVATGIAGTALVIKRKEH